MEGCLRYLTFDGRMICNVQTQRDKNWKEFGLRSNVSLIETSAFSLE